MTTDPAQARAIEASLELAGERGGDLTDRAYGLLFQRQPAMEALFWRDTSGAIRGEMLMKVFEAILDFVGERRYADHMIRTEVVTHAGYDVPMDVFPSFFGIVHEVVREACGGGWTAQMETAWAQLLADIDSYIGAEALAPA